MPGEDSLDHDHRRCHEVTENEGGEDRYSPDEHDRLIGLFRIVAESLIAARLHVTADWVVG